MHVYMYACMGGIYKHAQGYMCSLHSHEQVQQGVCHIVALQFALEVS
jgi:hypothetical protein